MFVQAHKCCINFRHSPRSEAKIKKINQVTLIPTRWQLLLLLPDFVERIQKPTLSSLIIKATEIMAHDNSPGVPPYDGSLCVCVFVSAMYIHTQYVTIEQPLDFSTRFSIPLYIHLRKFSHECWTHTHVHTQSQSHKRKREIKNGWLNFSFLKKGRIPPSPASQLPPHMKRNDDKTTTWNVVPQRLVVKALSREHFSAWLGHSYTLLLLLLFGWAGKRRKLLINF